MKLKIEYVDINLIKPNEYNPKKMSKEEYEQLRESIEKFGLVDPLIVNSAPERYNILIGGHQRLVILKELNYQRVPVVYINEPNIQREQELCLRLSKNTGSWDLDLLANIDDEILLDIGFDKEELLDLNLLDLSDIELNKTERKNRNIEVKITFYNLEDYQEIIEKIRELIKGKNIIYSVKGAEL